MKYIGNKVEGIKIAYVGGGSRGWAWGLMSDLASAADISGTVKLYDIDKEAAEANVIIGQKFNHAEGAISHWDYVATNTLGEALDGADCTRSSYIEITADFIRIGVLPEMKDLERRRLYERIGT